MYGVTLKMVTRRPQIPAQKIVAQYTAKTMLKQHDIVSLYKQSKNAQKKCQTNCNYKIITQPKRFSTQVIFVAKSAAKTVCNTFTPPPRTVE